MKILYQFANVSLAFVMLVQHKCNYVEAAMASRDTASCFLVSPSAYEERFYPGNLINGRVAINRSLLASRNDHSFDKSTNFVK